MHNATKIEAATVKTVAASVPAFAGQSNPRAAIVEAAKLMLGVRETSRNRFRGDRLIWAWTDYPDGWENREPYCAAFVCATVGKAREVEPLLAVGEPCKSASVQGWYAWARRSENGVMRPRVPGPGDIVSFLPKLSHIGIVESYDSARKQVWTIEGNTDGSGGRDGDGFYRKMRPLSTCGEFYRMPCEGTRP